MSSSRAQRGPPEMRDTPGAMFLSSPYPSRRAPAAGGRQYTPGMRWAGKTEKTSKPEARAQMPRGQWVLNRL